MYNQINVQNIKNYFRKPTTLVLAISLAIPVIISAIINIITLAEVTSILRNFNSLTQNNSIDLCINFNATSSVTSSIVGSVFAFIPTLLWLWIYLSSKSNDINKTPNTPFLINYIFSILGLVGSILSIIFSGILFVLSIILFDNYDGTTPTYNSDEYELIASILLLIAIVLFFVGIISLIYNIAKVKFFGSTRKSMTSDRMIPSGGLYGVLSIIYAILNFLVSVGCIFFGFFLLGYKPNLLDLTHDPLAIISQFRIFTIAFIVVGFSGFVSTFSKVLEGIVALGYNKMAKTAPPTPNFNPYGNNGYPQYNQFNQNQYNPNFNNYNNQNYNNTNYNNQYYNNQPYQNNQGYVNQQPNIQQTAVPTEPTNNDYNDGFDELNKHLDNQINNETNLNTNPYENK